MLFIFIGSINSKKLTVKEYINVDLSPGENYKNIDDLLNDALTLEQNSKTHTTTLNPGIVFL